MYRPVPHVSQVTRTTHNQVAAAPYRGKYLVPSLHKLPRAPLEMQQKDMAVQICEN